MHLITSVSSADVATFREDGVVCLRGVFDLVWIERLRAAIERALPAAQHLGASSETAGFAQGVDLHAQDAEVRRFIFESNAAELAATLMQTQRLRLFKDHFFVKHPGAATPTPWHHDLPYWCVDGDQVASFWIPLDVVDRHNGAVQYVRGSHRWNALYNPTDFATAGPRTNAAYEPIPDIEAMRDRLNIVSYDVRPGDVIAFHAKTIHGATGNATGRRRGAYSVRWAGDDAVYCPRRTSTPPYRDPGLAAGDPLGGDVFPLVFER